MRRRVPSPAVVIAGVALFFSLTGAGLAATGYRITSIWQISPGVRSALRGDAGKQGLPGPQGPAGAQGAAVQGPQGPPVDFADEYEVTARSPIVLHDGFVTGGVAVAQCHGDDFVVTGGFYVEDARIVESAPSDDAHGWGAVAYQDPDAWTASSSVEAFAWCLPS